MLLYNSLCTSFNPFNWRNSIEKCPLIYSTFGVTFNASVNPGLCNEYHYKVHYEETTKKMEFACKIEVCFICRAITVTIILMICYFYVLEFCVCRGEK